MDIEVGRRHRDAEDLGFGRARRASEEGEALCIRSEPCLEIGLAGLERGEKAGAGCETSNGGQRAYNFEEFGAYNHACNHTRLSNVEGPLAQELLPRVTSTVGVRLHLPHYHVTINTA